MSPSELLYETEIPYNSLIIWLYALNHEYNVTMELKSIKVQIRDLSEIKDFMSVIPLSHYSKNVLRTYYEHKMSKFVLKSARIFSFFQI